jgi:hypothetical protein
MRTLPRVPVEKLAHEVARQRSQLALVTDLSPGGLCLHQRQFARRESRIIQLELQLPEIEELAWVQGQVCFDRLRSTPAGPIRSTGIRVVAAAHRHLRLLRDWVMASVEAQENPLLNASHWCG